ncbi:hybrid sensor histidine kinase/response regulator [Burkholderia vietnamiensis]|uniref:hybrid sensor histidine kinase/response regulator n=1 Tax=Burkholderia vietnamiensis TaxID=60552 RepID=UPI00075408A7|nr:hybrid sensor histidine kinase/response regulator [Burkholderia vietnamiensis]AOJ15294.1 hybrid sensor histidine kinase/response regulator [Burkholderia vietnamiensis]KVE56561.1 hybrid sensor histidine kinase/response regulator [Burkholderia vietnamiensis]KVE90098.1 hybrid sensor histidine kinase/response regulator [Burkholderia vietnamiensis]KVE99646.1 hybrid sensor histidine kinase/response regulator [Burkholderia vietnamiensis]KVG08742.1 hybrid sensor histidine kinase/response regulator 
MKESRDQNAPDCLESGLSILLVDDQPFVGEVIRRALRSEPDIDLHVCTDAHRALAVARDVKPTVILQDLVMPDIDGLDLVRAWRAHVDTARVPIIVLSAKEEPVVKREAFIAGANDYLVKLPDAMELTARIRYHSSSYLMARQRDEALDFLSHDMRSPQTSILALLEVYRNEHGDMPALLERIAGHARRALALADGFIHLTRAQSERRAHELVSLDEVVLDAVDQLWEKALGFGSRIVAHVRDAECATMGDRMMLTRAVANLIDNALKYGPAGADIHCTLSDDDGAWLIGVEDAGSGIAPEQRAAATESFVRLESVHGATRGGFGLGLAFVRATAARHRGQILMRDTARGFMVALRLPAQRER